MSSKSFVIQDVRVFTGEEVIDSGFVHVENGQIVAVGSGGPTTSDAVLAISKPGHTLLPGLIDAHLHTDASHTVLTQSMKFGITTVLDMGSKTEDILYLKSVANERKDCADIRSAQKAAMVEGGWPVPVLLAFDSSPASLATMKTWPKISGPADADEFVARNVREGADYTKILHDSGHAVKAGPLPGLSTESQKALVTASRKYGVKCFAHATGLEDTLQVLEAGVDGVMHTIYDKSPSKELAEAYKHSGAFCNPTLGVIANLTGERDDIRLRLARDPRVTARLDQETLDRLTKTIGLGKPASSVKFAYESVRMLHEANIDIICGSDTAHNSLGSAYGFSHLHELSLLVHEGGLTPQEALRSATALTAARFGLEDRGCVATGRKADLLLVEGNPLADIEATLNLRGVWRDGIELQSV
ncbi:MAG: hypothetical protein Q9165_008187 [Trypethelium subeluteriae]